MKKRYYELDSLRGIAALMVLSAHYISLFPYLGSPVMHSRAGEVFSFIWNGHSAVIMFFLLSGFVLSLPFYNKKQIQYNRYIIKRICRIYIPYIVIIFIAVGFKTIVHSQIGHIPGLVNWALWDSKTTFNSLINHFFFIGEYDANTFVMVIWSLVHEMRISIIFPFVAFLLVRLNWKFSLLFALILSVFSFLLMIQFPTKFNMTVSTNYYITLHYTSIFIMGALLAKYRNILIMKVNNLKALFKLLLLFSAVLFFNYPRLPFMVPSKIIGEIDFLLYCIVIDWFIAFGAGLIVLLALSSNIISKILVNRPIHFLGEISYSIYLVHPVVLISMIHVFFSVLSIPSILVFSLIITLIASWLCYKYIEKPAISLGNYLTKKMVRESEIEEKNSMISNIQLLRKE